jgi:hypothetical protein
LLDDKITNLHAAGTKSNRNVHWEERWYMILSGIAAPKIHTLHINALRKKLLNFGFKGPENALEKSN